MKSDDLVFVCTTHRVQAGRQAGCCACCVDIVFGGSIGLCVLSYDSIIGLVAVAGCICIVCIACRDDCVPWKLRPGLTD